MSDITPIRPEEVDAVKARSLPQEVLAIVNNLILANWNGSRAVVTRSDLIDRIITALRISRQDIFDRGYLDIEGAYRLAGWDVEYDKPGFNESYNATFIFSKPKRPVPSAGR
jgi:hypothetical protein